MKLKHLLITSVFLLFPYQLYADTIGVYVGAGVWSHSAEGYISDSADEFDLQDDLKLKDNQEGYFYIAVEHPLPVIPNIRFASTKMSHEGDGTITATKVFGGVTYSASENVVSTIVLDSTDITAYYEILDNVVEIDLGLTARKIDGRIRIIGSTQTGEEKINDTIPMVYLAFGVNIPIGISLNAETNFMSAGGVTYSDLAVKLRYEFATVFGVEAGVRTQKLVLKNVDNVSADTTFGGPFIGAFVHF